MFVNFKKWLAAAVFVKVLEFAGDETISFSTNYFLRVKLSLITP